MPKQLTNLTPSINKSTDELKKELQNPYINFKDEQALGYRTAESVSPKHPDKLCDQISDAILDAYISKDLDSKVAVEVVGGHGKLLVIGEVSSIYEIEIKPIINRLVGDINLEVKIVNQSPEIARGVNLGGAGDQGIMVGYACNETPEFLPIEVVLSRRLNKCLFNIWPYDGKTQITLCGEKVTSIVASFQNAKAEELDLAILDWAKSDTLVNFASDVKIHTNPAGDWSIGGFDADTGLTGRKLVVDNYGPRIPIGGGCFSGKDPSKVDRSGAYMARKIALDYLKKRNAKEVYCHLAYAIGKSEPLQATVTIDGIQEMVSGYDLSPNGIIKLLDLKKPVYEQTASYGHFGNSTFFWEM